MQHYDAIAEFDREGFTIIVDKTWEDLHPRDCFDTSTDPDTGLPYYDVDQMCQDIDQGRLDWFCLRVRVMLDDLELAVEYLGGCLYDSHKVADVLSDGTAEELIHSALYAARSRAGVVYQQLGKVLEICH
jgi:hypothetical protein